MNKHIFPDNLVSSLGAMIAGKRKFFAHSIKSPSLEEQVAGVELTIPEFQGEGIIEIKAKSPAGELDPAFCVAQWKGDAYPTIIYHHGNNERPFDFKKRAKNTFAQIFIHTSQKMEANLIVVRAPFHNCPLKHYQLKMVELNNFTAMIATSAKLSEEIIQQLKRTSSQPIITAGISLGGWVTNLHRGIFNTSTTYAPIMAGTYLGELFLRSKYRKMTSPLALNHPEEIRRALNFNHVFENRNTPNVFPLLARYDQFIEYEVQKESYKGYPLKTIDNGHVTGALNTRELKSHLLSLL